MYNGGNSTKQGHKVTSTPQSALPLPFVELTSDNYVSTAENVINKLNKNRNNSNDKNKSILTTSQIRNLLTLNSEIYNIVCNDTSEILCDNVCAKLQYLKVLVIYQAGREHTVKDFIQESHLTEHLDKIRKSREKYIIFSRYLEALVAYRKFKGNGKDS